MILHVPHASKAIPESELGRYLLDRNGLQAELDAITDADTDRLAFASAGLARKRPWIFENLFSRLLIDPERFDGPEEEMLAVGMGPVYLKTTRGEPLRPEDPADDERLMEAYYRPYAKALKGLVAERLASLGGVLLIDIHSFPREALPYELHKEQARPGLDIGTHPVHTPQCLVDLIDSAWPGPTELNQPFSGTYVPSGMYGKESRVKAVMLEIRRDYMSTWVDEEDSGRREHPDIAGAVAAVIDSFQPG